MLGDPWELGQRYEANRALEPATRKRDGAFYTPRWLAERIAAVALAPFVGKLDVRVLDPAVGAGAFLLAAIEVLVGQGLTRTNAAACCTGLDRDPIALAVARQALALQSPGVPAPELRASDALLHKPQPKYDVVIGNPPWEKIARTDPRYALFNRYYAEVREGEVNLYGLFLVWALRCLRPGGRMAMITPNTWLLNRWDSRLRMHILSHRVVELWQLPAGTFSATPMTIPAVLIVDKAITPGVEANRVGPVSIHIAGRFTVASQSIWQNRPHAAMSPFDDRQLAAIEAKINRNCRPLGQMAHASDGIYTSTARKWATNAAVTPSDRKILLAGSELGRDVVLHAGAFIPAKLWEHHAQLHRFPRIVLHAARHPRLNRRIVGAVVPGEVYTSNRFINVVSDTLDPFFLAAVLLSSAVNGLFARRFPVADVDAFMLAQIPIPSVSIAVQGELSNLAQRRAKYRRDTVTIALAQRSDRAHDKARFKPRADFAGWCAEATRRIDGTIDAAVLELLGLSTPDGAWLATHPLDGTMTKDRKTQ